MTKQIEDSLEKIPILRPLVRLGKKVELPALEGITLYDIIELYIIGIVKGALTSRAGGIAFSFFMALFPFLLFILTLIPYVPIDNFQTDFLVMIERILPPNTWQAVDEVIQDIANNRYSGLLSFGFIASIFLMTNGVNAILGGFEYSYHIEIMRNVVKQYFISMIMAFVLSFILLFAVVVAIYFEIGIANLKYQGWLADEVYWVEISRYIIFLLLIFVSVSFLYRYGSKEVKYRYFVTPGSIFTTVLAAIMFKVFAIYVTKFSTYNELYGSIGTLLILMLFVWINSIILLLGFELNASYYRLKRLHLIKEFGKEKPLEL